MPLHLGIIGAGPWARDELGPAILEHPEMELSGVWSRSSERADATATVLDRSAFSNLGDLINSCDAVVLAVAPSAQPELAMRAAEAGCAVWCEKPLAPDVTTAKAVAAAFRASGARSFFHLPYRESAAIQELAVWAATAPIDHVNVRFYSGALLRQVQEPAGWRRMGSRADGVLLDLGPHGCGLAEQVGGPIRTVSATVSRSGWHLYCEHDTCTSTTALMARVAIDPSVTDVEVMADDRRGSGQGYRHANARSESRRERTLRSLGRFARIVESETVDHPFTVDAGLHSQLVLDAAQRSAAEGTAVAVRGDVPLEAE